MFIIYRRQQYFAFVQYRNRYRFQVTDMPKVYIQHGPLVKRKYIRSK